MDLELNGKTALITGASKGIGRAIAMILAEEGCNLHLAARTELDLLVLHDELKSKFYIQVTIHATDLSIIDNVVSLADITSSVDILINNAGAIPAGDIARLDVETIKDAWDLKVFGFVGLTKAIYPEMCHRGHGVIVNIIGMAGERSRPNYIAGAMGNAALMALTRALGSESYDKGVRVVGINPGPIETDRLVTQAKTTADMTWGDEARWRETMKGLPGGRAGSVMEIAWVVAFLSSPRASWVSGTTVMVDGGQHSRPPA
jgi:NAD(P)-dependent dehydrogenase (short-subunit alcohol dehydrogenase family)